MKGTAQVATTCIFDWQLNSRKWLAWSAPRFLVRLKRESFRTKLNTSILRFLFAIDDSLLVTGGAELFRRRVAQ